MTGQVAAEWSPVSGFDPHIPQSGGKPNCKGKSQPEQISCASLDHTGSCRSNALLPCESPCQVHAALLPAERRLDAGARGAESIGRPGTRAGVPVALPPDHLSQASASSGLRSTGSSAVRSGRLCPAEIREHLLPATILDAEELPRMEQDQNRQTFSGAGPPACVGNGLCKQREVFLLDSGSIPAVACEMISE